MLYLLLIVPHLAAIAGLLAYAFRSNPLDEGDESGDRPSGGDGDSGPPPTPGGDSPRMPREVPPRHRIRDERHSRSRSVRPRRRAPAQ